MATSAKARSPMDPLQLLPHGLLEPSCLVECGEHVGREPLDLCFDRLSVGRYIGSADVAADGEAIEAKIERLTANVLAAFDETARLEKAVREQLERIHG